MGIVAKQRFIAELAAAQMRYLQHFVELLKDEPPGLYHVYDEASGELLPVEKPGTIH